MEQKEERKWEVSSVTCTVKNKIFHFNPTTCYEMNDDTKTIVILYDLHEINNDDKTTIHTATIPYYVSDGWTNGFRANMLFPFLCFTKKGEHKQNPPVCPYSDRGDIGNNGMLKIQINGHLDTEKIQTTINDQYSDLVNRQYEKKEGETRSEEYQRELSLKASINFIITTMRTFTLRSIAPRMENIIDCMIALSSPVVKDYYHGGMSAELQSNLLPVRDPNIKYEFQNIIRGDISRGEITYRVVMLAVFQHMFKLLKTAFRVKYRTLFIPIQSISINQFNETMNVCRDIPNTQSQLHIYREMSQDLYELLLEHNEELDEKKRFPYLLLKEKQKFNTYRILSERQKKEKSIDENKPVRGNEFDFILHQWNATCGKKSKKSKNKSRSKAKKRNSKQKYKRNIYS